MRRRPFLQRGAGTAGLLGLAGCTGLFAGESFSEPPLVEDPPDAVYYPSHVEGMEMGGTGGAGPYHLAITYSFPHRFWTVTGRDKNLVSVRSEDTVHLMTIVWDVQTETVLPVAEISLDVRRDGETVVEKTPWPMLSQPMGYHFGDNVTLPGDGTYEVQVRIAPLSARATGAFSGRFTEVQTATATVEYSRTRREEISFRRLVDLQGEPGAVSPMEMGLMPLARLPPEEELPGDRVGSATSGDGRFVVSALDSPPEGVDGDGTYLVVSARTPHNRFPLPFMALSASVSRDGSTVYDDPLTPTVDPDLDYHYGATLGRLEAGDTIELTVDAPPQVARHEGYETAFFDMPPMALRV